MYLFCNKYIMCYLLNCFHIIIFTYLLIFLFTCLLLFLFIGILVAKKSLFVNPVPSGCGGGSVFFVSKTKFLNFCSCKICFHLMRAFCV